MINVVDTKCGKCYSSIPDVSVSNCKQCSDKSFVTFMAH